MDPYDEQRFRNEVIYLHSLWHQGPPRPTPSTHSLHQLANPPRFKRQRINPTWKRAIESKNQDEEEGKSPSQFNQISGKEWTRSSTSGGSPAPTTGWPDLTALPISEPLLLSPEQQARLAAKQAQLKALNATKEFFRAQHGHDEDDNDDNDGNEVDGDDDLMEEEDEGADYCFFLKMFKEDCELREYYEKNNENGEFSCLVCGGVGKKNSSKKFKDCTALVQHSISIAKTKKRHSHRAYGRAICKVLGWEVNRLPTIVLSLDEKLGASLNNSAAAEAEAQGNVGDETKGGGKTEAPVDTSNCEELGEKESISNENLPDNAASVVLENSLAAAEASQIEKDFTLTVPEESFSSEQLPNNDEFVVLENSLAAAEASKCAEDLNLLVPEMVDKESAQTNHLNSLWHQGTSRSLPSTHPLHQLANPPQLKKQSINPKWKNSIKSKNHYEDEGKNPTQSIQVSGKEWPCISTSIGSLAPTTGWPDLTDTSISQPLLVSPEQQTQLAANQAQLKALNATKEFFKFQNSDDDEEEEDSDNEVDDDLMEEEDDEGVDYRFFLKMFMEDSELREYYEKNYENGDFSCLVCGGVGKKNSTKRFKDCMALVQHSISIAKTKKRHSHRAYGQAICKVLGWMFDRLPSIVLSLDKKLGASLNNSGVADAEAQGNACDETKDGLNSLGKAEAPVHSNNCEELGEKESISENFPSNDALVVLENSLAAAEAPKCAEDLSSSIAEVVVDKESAQANHLHPRAEDLSSTMPKVMEDKESGQTNDVEPPGGQTGVFLMTT